VVIVWDDAKRLTNLAKHGLDFADLTLEFFVKAASRSARNGRFLAVGRLNGNVIVAVVFVPLGREAISVIWMRPAGKKERSYAP